MTGHPRSEALALMIAAIGMVAQTGVRIFLTGFVWGCGLWAGVFITARLLGFPR
jgi:hypothetical protein